MHKGIFSRLAKQNIRNNKSTYIPYIITCIFCIAMIYMMEFLRDCPTLDQAVRQADEVRMIVFTGEIVVEIFCIIFLTAVPVCFRRVLFWPVYGSSLLTCRSICESFEKGSFEKKIR